MSDYGNMHNKGTKIQITMSDFGNIWFFRYNFDITLEFYF